MLLSYSAFSQRQLLASDAPQAGESVDWNTGTDQQNPGTSGSGVTWDFSNIGGSQQSSASYVSASGTPYASDFPQANIAVQAGDFYGYRESTSSEILYYGSAIANGLPIIYTNPRKELEFPFSFNNSFSDTWAYEITSSPTVYTEATGSGTVTYDGSGTLITPAGTFQNAIRIRSEESTTSTTYINGAPNTPTTSSYTSHTWYIPGSGIAALVIGESVSNGQSYWSHSYNMNPNYTPPVGIDEASAAALPVVYQGQGQLILEAPQQGQVELWSVTGQQVQRQRYLAGRSALSTAGLVPGMYVLKLRSGEHYSSKKVVVTAP